MTEDELPDDFPSEDEYDLDDLLGDDPAFRRRDRDIAATVRLGLTIKRLRKRRGLNGLQFAAQLGVSEAHVSRWESGSTYELSMRDLSNIARVLNVDMWDILRIAFSSRP